MKNVALHGITKNYFLATEQRWLDVCNVMKHPQNTDETIIDALENDPYYILQISENIPDAYGRLMVHAVLAGRLSVVEHFLPKCVAINSTYLSLLMAAIVRISYVDPLLVGVKNWDTSLPWQMGAPNLHLLNNLAIQITRIEALVQKILAAEVCNINQVYEDSGQTALMIAAQYGLDTIVKQLLEKGAVSTLRTSTNATAFELAQQMLTKYQAISSNDPKISQYLATKIAGYQNTITLLTPQNNPIQTHGYFAGTNNTDSEQDKNPKRLKYNSSY